MMTRCIGSRLLCGTPGSKGGSRLKVYKARRAPSSAPDPPAQPIILPAALPLALWGQAAQQTAAMQVRVALGPAVEVARPAVQAAALLQATPGLRQVVIQL